MAWGTRTLARLRGPARLLLAGRRAFAVATDPPVTGTLFDARGQVSKVQAVFPRKQFLQETGLHTRELRHIDGQTGIVPRIFVHRGVMLINVCDLRVLIRRDRAMVFASKDPAVTERLGMLTYDIVNRMSALDGPQSESVYIQTILEAVLVHSMAYMEIELARLRKSLDVLLKDLELEANRKHLKELLIGSKMVDTFYRKAVSVRECLSDALDDVDYFLEMYPRSETTKETDTSIELLLEAYHKQADELVQNADRMARDIDTTEDIVAMVSDLNRNSLLLFRLELSIATVGCAFAVFFFDLYGMNLENFIEETSWGLPAVLVPTALLTLAFTRFNVRHLSLAKRVTMSGTASMVGPQRHSKEWLQMPAGSPPASTHPPRERPL